MSKPASTSSVERERKLLASPEFVMPSLDGIDGAAAAVQATQRLDATYYDTPSLRLARSGITVRFRSGEGADPGDGKWTVKLPDGEDGPALARREIDLAGNAASVPDAVASLLRAHVRSDALVPVAQLRTERRRIDITNADGASAVEVADDEVSVVQEGVVTKRFREIEIEARGPASPELLDEVGARIEGAGGESGAQVPKLVRALGPRAVEPADAAVPELDAGATMSEIVAASIASAMTRLLAHDPGVRLGGDAEDVHQARVAARRLRSDLRTFRPVLDPTKTKPLADGLQWIGAQLGGVRDNDVLLEHLRSQSESLPASDTRAAAALLARLEAEGDERRADLLRALDSDRYVEVLEAIAEAIVNPPMSDDSVATAKARKVLPQLVRLPWKHLREAVAALGSHPDDEALHEVRIRAKRVRYASEAAEPVLGRSARRFAKAAAELQTVLGDLNDAVVAEAWLRGTGRRGPAAQAFVAGQLIGVQRAAMQAARERWPAVWDELASKKLRTWLD